MVRRLALIIGNDQYTVRKASAEETHSVSVKADELAVVSL